MLRAESRPVTYVTPNYTIDSASVANSADYELVYYGNADGTLKITNSDNETVLSDAGVKANTKVYTQYDTEKRKQRFPCRVYPECGLQTFRVFSVE